MYICLHHFMANGFLNCEKYETDYVAMLMSKVCIVPCNTSQHVMQGCSKTPETLAFSNTFFFFFLSLLVLDPVDQCVLQNYQKLLFWNGSRNSGNDSGQGHAQYALPNSMDAMRMFKGSFTLGKVDSKVHFI